MYFVYTFTISRMRRESCTYKGEVYGKPDLHNARGCCNIILSREFVEHFNSS
jgi:hypothetical protein